MGIANIITEVALHAHWIYANDSFRYTLCHRFHEHSNYNCLYYLTLKSYQSPIQYVVLKLRSFSSISHGNYVQGQGGHLRGGIRGL